MPLRPELQPIESGVHMLIQSIFDESVLSSMITEAPTSSLKENPLNENFNKKEFQTLWNAINHKYAYTVRFDSAELIRNAVTAINDQLHVSALLYTTTTGQQKDILNEHEIDRGDSFGSVKTKTQTLRNAHTGSVRYDLVGKIAEGAVLTRKTTAAILAQIDPGKFYMFRNNPEEFIAKVVHLIKGEKANMIVESISYNIAEGQYDRGIFTADKSMREFAKAFRAKKAIQDYIFTDGTAEDSVEKRFATDLEAAEEVCVYAKLPRGFAIPTPVGNYAPDWAIAFREGSVKHICFIAETKGSSDSFELRPIETAKINCAKKLFNKMSTSIVRYEAVADYAELLAQMQDID